MLSTANITMQFGPKPLFENVSVKFNEGGHYGLIGANGAGKSTFMKILAGTLAQSHGTVMTGPNERVASLTQDQYAFDDYTLLDTVMMGHKEMYDVKAERDRIYSLPEMSEADGIKVADLEMQFAEFDGYTAESRAGELLLGVDIPVDLHTKKMAEIAPGLKLRVLLTQVLFSNPDIMLLDEPTNNLDINTIRWLEGELRERKCTMIIISHDRHFLNQVCTNMADLDYNTIQLYPGNYDDFMLASTQAREKLQSENAQKKKKIAELQTFVSRFSANASKARQATSRVKQIDKLQLEKIKPSTRKSPYIIFKFDKKLHRLAVETDKLANGYDDLLFKDITLHLDAGEKIAIIGANGVGKTTLVKTLIGEMEPKAGKVKWAENADIGYFEQDHGKQFEQDINLYDWICQWGKPTDDEQVLRGTLGRLLFSTDASKKKVNVTSGGEKVRLLLGKLILQQPNVLVMDEPTNHLDMEAIEALHSSLEEFSGTLIFVSHDRELVSGLATQILELQADGSYVYYKGNYEDYLASKG